VVSCPPVSAVRTTETVMTTMITLITIPTTDNTIEMNPSCLAFGGFDDAIEHATTVQIFITLQGHVGAQLSL